MLPAVRSVVFRRLNMMKIAFFLSAIGANLAWLIALYSYSSFAVTRSKLKDVASAPD